MEKTKEKRSFQAPHTFVILVVLILIAVGGQTSYYLSKQEIGWILD